MRIGITIPTLSNYGGLIESINSMRSSQHHLEFSIVNTGMTGLSVAAAWNGGVDDLLRRGCGAVIVSNDDVLCHRGTIDGLVAAWLDGDADLVSARNVRGTVGVLDFLTSDIACVGPFDEGPSPDFSFFLLPSKTWEVVGRFDENFRPAYFEDNDYHARLVLSGLRAVNTSRAPFYHFGSGTQNADPKKAAVPAAIFDANRDYFVAKWGRPPVNDEAEMRVVYYPTPFNDPLISLSACPKLR